MDELEHVEPTWLTLARAEIGVHETPGPGSTSRIDEYLHAVTKDPHVNDETPWCSAFANWCMVRAQRVGSGKLAARSWLSWGVACEPQLGAVVVLWREDPKGPHGHVAFFVKEDATNVYLLGGNQHNSVCISAYPKSRVLGYRWPAAL
jgi:uncharacterized protein (TIGR02594 family)